MYIIWFKYYMDNTLFKYNIYSENMARKWLTLYL